MSATLTTSFTSNNNSISFNMKHPFSVKLDRFYKEVMKSTETESNDYREFKNEKKDNGKRDCIDRRSFNSLNDEISKTKLSYLIGKKITFTQPFALKAKKSCACDNNNTAKKDMGFIDRIKSSSDSLREFKKTFQKSKGYELTSPIFKSPQGTQRKNALFELKGNNEFIAKMKKSFPEYLTPISSFISFEKPSTQRMGRIRHQLSKI